MRKCNDAIKRSLINNVRIERIYSLAEAFRRSLVEIAEVCIPRDQKRLDLYVGGPLKCLAMSSHGHANFPGWRAGRGGFLHRELEDTTQFPPQTHKSDGLQARIVLQLRKERWGEAR